MIDSDVLVVGGGLAGMTAALAAAREGARVRLVSRSESTLRSASGLVDVLGTVGEAGPISDPFDAIDGLPAEHPYRAVGRDALRAGLSFFDDVTGDAYAGDHTDRNALVPTAGGRVKPTARYPASVAPGLAGREEDALLVGFETLVDVDAPLAADRLAARVPCSVDGVTVSFPGDLRTDAARTRYAHALDGDETVAVDERASAGDTSADGAGVPARRALAERVTPHLDGHERVGFPAMLGERRPAAVRDDLADLLGAAVFEIPTGPPSLLGLRLESLFEAALRDAGVALEIGHPVVGYEASDGTIEHVLVDRDGRQDPYHADQFVLATGGLVGKGVAADRERVVEPVFDCHVPHPGDRYAWSEADAFGDHAFAEFGVRVDGSLRPLDAGGSVEFDNLRAAGAVLGGFDFAAEQSGSGVSLATGHAAGTAATRDP